MRELRFLLKYRLFYTRKKIERFWKKDICLAEKNWRRKNYKVSAMKNSKKVFLLIEVVLGIMVIIMAFFMIRERSGENLERISVIVQKSDDNQWTAFQYGLKMAAEDQGVELFVVGTGDELTVEEQKNLMEQEISKGGFY